MVGSTIFSGIQLFKSARLRMGIRTIPTSLLHTIFSCDSKYIRNKRQTTDSQRLAHNHLYSTLDVFYFHNSPSTITGNRMGKIYFYLQNIYAILFYLGIN